MDDLISTLIFIAIVIGSIVGQVRSKQKAGNNPKASKQEPLAVRIEKFLARIQERIEASTAQKPSIPDDWNALMDDAADGASEEAPMDDVIDGPRPGYFPEPVARPVPRAARAAVPPPPEKRRQHRGRRRYACGRSDLRRAVVWSEILEPPVALRDRHLHR